jgi:hypothetical protein
MDATRTTEVMQRFEKISDGVSRIAPLPPSKCFGQRPKCRLIQLGHAHIPYGAPRPLRGAGPMFRDLGLPARGDRHHAVGAARAECRCRPPDHFGDVGLRQVAVMSLDHARVGVAKVLRDDQQRGSSHDREASPRMTQRMEVQRWQDFRVFARRLQGAMLVRFAPRRTVSLHKDPLIAGTAGAQPSASAA